MKKEKRDVIAIFGIIFVVWFWVSLLLGYFVYGFDGIMAFVILGSFILVLSVIVLIIMDILSGK